MENVIFRTDFARQLRENVLNTVTFCHFWTESLSPKNSVIKVDLHFLKLTDIHER